MKAEACCSIIRRYSTRLIGQIPVTSISNIQPLTKSEPTQPNILYFGTLSQALELGYFKDHPKLFLLLVQDCTYTYLDSFIMSSAVFEVASEASLSACVTELLSYLQIETNVLQTSNNFFHMLLTLQSLSKVIDVSASYFHIPLIVGSPGGRKILAVSRTVTGDPDDPLWASIVKTHTFSIEQHCYDMQHNYGKDYTSNIPYIVHYPSTDKWRIMSKIYAGDNYLGLLHTYDAPFDQIQNIDTGLFQCLSSIVARFIQIDDLTNSIHFLNKNNYIISLLGDMLDAEEGCVTVETNEIPYDHFRLINFALSKYQYGCNQDGYLIDFFRNLFIHSIAFYYRRNVLLLLNVKKDAHLLTDKREYLEQILQKNHITGIIGDPFININQLKSNYNQTERILRIIQLLNVTDVLVYCDTYKFYDIALSACPKNHPEYLYQFCNTKLLEIRAGTRGTGSELYQTLREYVLSNKSLSQTSKKLFLHKSTVAYRIRQIKEIYQIELEDFQEVFSFYYSVLLIDLVEALTETAAQKESG